MEYERAYGSINIDGKDYEYVKRRVYNDTLELLCIPNRAKTDLKIVGNDIAKATADGQASTPQKKSATTLKISLPDFCQMQKSTVSSLCEISESKHVLLDTKFLPSNYTSQLERPPKPMQQFIAWSHCIEF